MVEKWSCWCQREECHTITTQLHTLLNIPTTSVSINTYRALNQNNPPTRTSHDDLVRIGLNEFISKFIHITIKTNVSIEPFHYAPKDRHALFNKPKFHVVVPNTGIQKIQPTYENNDAIKELEYLKQLQTNDIALLNSIEKEVIGIDLPVKYVQLLNEYLEQQDDNISASNSPVKKKANNNNSTRQTSLNSTTSSELLTTELSTDAKDTTTSLMHWKTKEYIDITDHATKYLLSIDRDEVNRSSDIKDKLRNAEPMKFNTTLLEVLRETGILKLCTINKEDYLITKLQNLAPITVTKQQKGDIPSCVINQQQLSRRRETRETNVYFPSSGRTKGKINIKATKEKKDIQASRTIIVNMKDEMSHIAWTLLPVNDLKSKAQGTMAVNLKNMGYKVLSQDDAKFGSTVYCDAVELDSNHMNGLWRVLDGNNGDMVAYVDTKGCLPLSKKMSANPKWQKGGVGVIYVLVKDAVDIYSITQAITTMEKYDINHLPIAILWLIREAQQNNAAMIKRKSLEKKIDEIYNNDQYDIQYERLSIFLIILREVTTSYVHLLSIPMLLRRAWIAWNCMRSRWDWMYPDDEIAIRKESRKSSNIVQNDTVMNDGIIVSCSSQGDDDDVWRWYRTLTNQLVSSNRFMESIQNKSIIDVLDTVTSVFDMGINGVRAESHLQIMFISAIRYNGSLPEGVLLEGLYHVSNKKRFLIGNETGKYEGVPMDRHIIKIFGLFAPENVTRNEKENWALAFSHRMNELVGADANNMLGQLSQWLNSRRIDTPQHEIAQLMLKRVAEIQPDFKREVDLWLGKD